MVLVSRDRFSQTGVTGVPVSFDSCVSSGSEVSWTVGVVGQPRQSKRLLLSIDKRMGSLVNLWSYVVLVFGFVLLLWLRTAVDLLG